MRLDGIRARPKRAKHRRARSKASRKSKARFLAVINNATREQ